MKFAHINSSNQILGWYTRDVHDLIPEPYIEVTDEEWLIALSNNFNTVDINGKTFFIDYSTNEEKEADARFDRNTKLLELDQIVSNPIRWNSFTSDIQQEFIKYRQELLDVPQQSNFPNNIVWPNKPEMMKVNNE